jgi:hypothetical protein
MIFLHDFRSLFCRQEKVAVRMELEKQVNTQVAQPVKSSVVWTPYCDHNFGRFLPIFLKHWRFYLTNNELCIIFFAKTSNVF